MAIDPAAIRIVTDRLLLALPGPARARPTLEYFVANRAHLAPWEPPLPKGFLTEEYLAEKLLHDQLELMEDRALRLFLFERARGLDGPVLGTCNFTQIMRGPLQSCFLGYGLAASAVGGGLMTEALRAAIPFVWRTLALHRIEANYVPSNERSGRVLRRLGFVVEGYARDYLWIGGAWRDHIRTALTNPAFVPPWNKD